MMNALIDARPEWDVEDTLKADREKMLRYGLSMGMTLEQLFRITDAEAMLGVRTEAAAKGEEP